MSVPTPGPWTVRRSSGVLGGEVERWAIDGPPQGLAGRWWIATAMSDEPRDEANARLIAAAPEMFDALQLVLEVDECFLAGPVLDAVEAAIAKAEGR